MHVAEQKLIALTKRPHLSQRERQQAVDPFAYLRALLRALGNPEEKIPHYIHVTGTSGKGSTAAYMTSILHANKHKTGLTVSPHVTSIYERWQINGVPINSRDFDRLVKKIETAFTKCSQADPKFGLSFFEICTALALLYFAEQKVEWAVLEVFNGGRVDPTNVIPRKDAAVITTIGLDHEQLLGNTKLKIAKEKSGIIIPQTLVFTGERDATIKSALKKNTKTKRAHFVPTPSPTHIAVSNHGTQFVVSGHAYRVPAIGAHQARNAALAIAIGRALGISTAVIERGLKNTVLPLRVEIVHKKPVTILDGAHNPDKIKATVTALQTLTLPPSLCLVVAFSPAKNIRAMVRELLSLAPDHIIITVAPGPMPSADPHTVAKFFPKSGLQPTIIVDATKAWQAAQSYKTILVTGSIYLASFFSESGKK